MVFITPGVGFLGQHLVLPAFIHYAGLSLTLFVIRPTIKLPEWAIVTASILLIPVRGFGGIAYRHWKNKREAEKRGARLPPAIQTGTFGNSALLDRMGKAWKEGYPGDEVWDFTREYGRVFNFGIMFADTVFTLEPDNVKRLLATDFDNFVKGERFQYALSAVLGSGVFNSDGEMWKFHRTMARPFFSRDRVSDLERFDKHIQKAISLFQQRMKTGYAIDFQDLAQRITMDTASEFLLGASVDSLNILADDMPQPYNHPHHHSSAEAFKKYPANVFCDAFLEAQLVAAQRDRHEWIWPLWEIFEDKAKPYMKVVDAFMLPIVEEAVAKNSEKLRLNGGDAKNEIGDDETLLDHLSSQTSDRKILKDQALNILIAGRDTVSATVTFLFYLLSKHPNVQQRLRDEVLDTIGPSKRPTFEDVKGMKYLRAVINETLRILPPVPWDVRECVKGTVWPSPDPNEKPIYIPPGTTCVYGLLMMGTDEELWGPDAAEFDPDRFLDDRKKHILANPFIFLPFNAGPRICLGQQLAYNQLSLIIIRILQAFSSFTVDGEAVPPNARVPENWANGPGRKAMEGFRPKVVLTMSCEGGMWLKADPVEREETI
ncbi:hypothetical protein D9611_008194 [Ephemerocybe angulata]|uniref:Cytochrome P450 n=1 Tax=Ephemerocybe angulata TaxID=980116 RepID=A0A8H5FD67_9AGAR|nr:hypothetical protein D9611_008194 [Tulosesus angulatus]